MTYQNPISSLSEVDSTTNKPKVLPPASPHLSSTQKSNQQPQGFSLRGKAILAAIALGVLPLTIIGGISYRVIQNRLTQQINQSQLSRTTHLAHMFEKYLKNRVNEAETLAASPIFTNPNVIDTVTMGQKRAALSAFQTQTGFYDNIVYLDLQGNPLFQGESERPLRKNYSKQQYFQKAIAQKTTVLNQLDISPFTGEPRIEFAIPVKNAWTDEVMGVLRFRIPSQEILPLFNDYAVAGEEIHLINTQGTFFTSTVENLNNQPLANHFPQLQQPHVTKQIATTVVTSATNSDRQQLMNYAPISLGVLDSELNLGTAISIDIDAAFAPLKTLKWIYVGGTIGTSILVGSIAGFLANRIVGALNQMTFAVNQLSEGKLDTRIKSNSQDELANLGDRINNMAARLQISMQRQKTQARTSELLTRISQARTSRELQLPFSMFLAEVRNILKSDRVIFYRFDERWWGTVIAESVASGFPRTLGVQFDDPCFAKEYVRKYQRGRIQAISDIAKANLTPCHLRQLEPYGVKASLVLPVILERPATPDSERLIGLAIAHQCSGTRVWSQADVDYLQQVAYQLAIVLRGYIVYKEENHHTTNLQKDLTGILSAMKEVSQGNLRVDLSSRSNSSSEVTKSFGKILDSLQVSIAKIQTPSQQIDRQLRDNKQDLAIVRDSLQQQTNQLALIFAFIEQIGTSILEVSSQADVASRTVSGIVTDLESEKVNFGRAITYMSQLEDNLRINRDRVKSLSSASQKMTRVIGSIKKINLRASLLASKLSKRIPELDESAFGLKEEIRSIQQSISATKELENVVGNIEREIGEVLQEYQKSENKLEQENYLVTDASRNLEHIVRVTKNAQQNLLSLVNITKMQQQTSQKIDNLKEDIDYTANTLTICCDRALASWEQTAITDKDLANVIDLFKLKN